MHVDLIRSLVDFEEKRSVTCNGIGRKDLNRGKRSIGSSDRKYGRTLSELAIHIVDISCCRTSSQSRNN